MGKLLYNTVINKLFCLKEFKERQGCILLHALVKHLDLVLSGF